VLAFEPGKSEMSGVGPCLFVPRAAEIVETMHENWVAGEALGRRHVSILKFSQIPPGPRRVPSPLSADSPAPVRMTMFW
jgi:hypothetical protein